MNNLDSMEDQQFVFGALLIVANRMDTLLERELKKYDVTAKQWFLSIVIENLFDEPATMKEIAREMGSSHQNVKQVALKLERKGLLKLEKDRKDARVTRLKLTDQSHKFWESTQSEAMAFTQALFKDIEKSDLTAVRKVLEIMISNLAAMETKERDE